MPITLTGITPLPDPPSKASPANFASRADAFLGALPDFATEFNSNVAELNKITSGLDQASPIAAWAAGTTYDFPTVVAGSDGYSYRCVGTDVVGVDPLGDAGTNWVRLGGSSIPVGAVIPFVGGYFTDGSGSGFTSVLGNTAASVNALVNPTGWYVCDGAECLVSGSSIFSAPGRHLPNLTDDRFIMGDSAAGLTAGSNSSAHTHTLSHTHTFSHTHTVGGHTHSTNWATLSESQMPSHQHHPYNSAGEDPYLFFAVYKSTFPYSAAPSTGSSGLRVMEGRVGSTGTSFEGGSSSHSHGETGSSSSFSTGAASPGATSDASSSTTSTASNTENRPKFLSAIYIMKVK